MRASKARKLNNAALIAATAILVGIASFMLALRIVSGDPQPSHPLTSVGEHAELQYAKNWQGEING